MAVGPKLRFEVFKRDDFTCQYCGGRTPAVILECDHVVPRAEGGTDEFENLTTACWECNRGKGAAPLGELPPSADVHERCTLLAEREMQIREYNAIRARIRMREESEIRWLCEIWEHYFPYARKLSAATLRHRLQSFSCYEVADAIEATAYGKERRVIEGNVIPYFYGVLKRMGEARGAK